VSVRVDVQCEGGSVSELLRAVTKLIDAYEKQKITLTLVLEFHSEEGK